VFAENVTQASRILVRINADIRNGKSSHWGIYLKETHGIVGTCGFYRGFAGNIGEIGYLLLPSAVAGSSPKPSNSYLLLALTG
jgi:ribosomal-protein-alanine N-acetyltransferase